MPIINEKPTNQPQDTFEAAQTADQTGIDETTEPNKLKELRKSISELIKKYYDEQLPEKKLEVLSKLESIISINFNTIYQLINPEEITRLSPPELEDVAAIMQYTALLIVPIPHPEPSLKNAINSAIETLIFLIQASRYEPGFTTLKNVKDLDVISSVLGTLMFIQRVTPNFNKSFAPLSIPQFEEPLPNPVHLAPKTQMHVDNVNQALTKLFQTLSGGTQINQLDLYREGFAVVYKKILSNISVGLERGEMDFTYLETNIASILNDSYLAFGPGHEEQRIRSVFVRGFNKLVRKKRAGTIKDSLGGNVIDVLSENTNKQNTDTYLNINESRNDNVSNFRAKVMQKRFNELQGEIGIIDAIYVLLVDHGELYINPCNLIRDIVKAEEGPSASLLSNYKNEFANHEELPLIIDIYVTVQLYILYCEKENKVPDIDYINRLVDNAASRDAA